MAPARAQVRHLWSEALGQQVFDRTESLAVLTDLTIFVDRLWLTQAGHYSRSFHSYCAERGIEHARPPVIDAAVATTFAAWAPVGIVGFDLILNHGAMQCAENNARFLQGEPKVRGLGVCSAGACQRCQAYGFRGAARSDSA